MKRHASIWTCGTLALCALLACAVSAAGLLYGTRWALLAPGALLGLGIAVLGGPVRAGLWSNALQRPQAALGLQLLPLAVGLLLPARAAGAGRWVCLALGLALLAPVGFALLGQMAGARDGALAALNAAFFRRARMENVSACLLLGAGLFLRAALPGGEKRA